MAVTSGEGENKLQYKKKPFYSIIKRIFDFFVSLIFITTFSWLYIIVAIIVAVSDGAGKPFFVQERVGKNGKTFKLYKFRTMCVDAEAKKAELMKFNEADGPAFKMKNDPRITKVGKVLRATNIDELPQMLNILFGHMSFVGPRPPLPKEVEQYSDTDRLRLLVTPGLTCYWQASLNRNDISFAQWMELDRKYIEDRSVWVDLKLIFKTIGVIIKHRDGR